MNRRYYSHSNGALNAKMASLSVTNMARQGVVSLESMIRQKMNHVRQWKLTNLGKKRPKWGFEFTVMTYNILSQSAIEDHVYLYRNCGEQFLTEEYRISKLMPEILKSRSDVICLQEVEQNLYDCRMKTVFESNGFESVFKKRTGSKSDGCAVFWRREKFNLLRCCLIELKAKESEYLNRDNVGLIAVLAPRHPRATNTQLHIATTHLIFNPRRGDVKLCQLRLLLAELEKSAFKKVTENGRTYHPTILCGDFNFEPHSPLYQFIENGRLDVTGLLSGNMSGQFEGKDKGPELSKSALSLEKLGIDETTRYQNGNKGNGGLSTNVAGNYSSHLTHKNLESRAGVSGNRQLSSYMQLLKGMQQSNTSNSSQFQFNGAPAAGGSKVKSGNNVEFLRDGSPSSSEGSAGSSELLYHPFNFVPTYKYHQQDKKSIRVTSMTGENTFNTVDHIFYHVKQKAFHSYVEDKLRLLAVYTLPHREDLKEIGGLPNAFLGSDHLKLIAKFVISFKT